MDKTGEGEEVQLADLPQAKELAFQGFGHDLFQEVRAHPPACAALGAEEWGGGGGGGGAEVLQPCAALLEEQGYFLHT